MGVRNMGIVDTQTAQSFCRKTSTLHFLPHLQWPILSSGPECPYICARSTKAHVTLTSYRSMLYMWGALRTICPVYLASGHKSCTSIGSEAISVLTNTKLPLSAKAAFKVLQTVFPLPLELLVSFVGGVLVTAPSPTRSLSGVGICRSHIQNDILAFLSFGILPLPIPQ